MGKWWTALKAAKKYIDAWATGDKASDDEALVRASICANCPSLRRYEESICLGLVAAHSGFCGEALNDRTGEADSPTCGCLVLAQAEAPTSLTIGGRPYEAAGKLTLASSRCPQGMWEEEKKGGSE